MKEKIYTEAMTLYFTGNNSDEIQRDRFTYEKRELPPPKPDEVTLKIRACGICGSDIDRVKGGAYHYPLVIGHEFSGLVEYDPENVLQGKRVVVFPLIPCGKCESCRRESYAMCENYDYYGSRRDGGLCTRLNVKRKNLLEIPDNVSWEEAAICEPAAVALNALKKCGDIAGNKIAIYGAGTVGLLAGQWAKIYRASDIYFADPDEDKLNFALNMGFQKLDKKTNPDIFVDACGNNKALCDILQRAEPCSKVILLGNPASDINIERNIYWQILRHELTLYGTWNSYFGSEHNDWRDVLNAQEQGNLKLSQLITHQFKLTDVNKAFKLILEHNFFVKVMINIDA